MTTLLVPTSEGKKDIESAIVAACASGKWTLVAPDGRIWQTELQNLFAVTAMELGGERLEFEGNVPKGKA